MKAHRPLPRVRSLVLTSVPMLRPSDVSSGARVTSGTCGSTSHLATRPDFGSCLIAATTSEADTLVRPQVLALAINADSDANGIDNDDTGDSVWRRRIIVRGSQRAVPLPF